MDIRNASQTHNLCFNENIRYFHTSLYLSILGTIVPLTLANFDIYADQAIDWNREKQQPGFRIFGGATSGNKLCDFVNKVRYIPIPPVLSD